MEKDEVQKMLPFSGMEFVVTGTLKAFSRTIAQQKIKLLGGTAKDDVTRRTRYLVVGEAPGSKLSSSPSFGNRSTGRRPLS